jgi:hypothetical protein
MREDLEAPHSRCTLNCGFGYSDVPQAVSLSGRYGKLGDARRIRRHQDRHAQRHRHLCVPPPADEEDGRCLGALATGSPSTMLLFECAQFVDQTFYIDLIHTVQSVDQTQKSADGRVTGQHEHADWSADKYFTALPPSPVTVVGIAEMSDGVGDFEVISEPNRSIRLKPVVKIRGDAHTRFLYFATTWAGPSPVLHLPQLKWCR